MKAIRIIKYSVLAIAAIAAAAFLHYNLPHTDVVQITGTDVKRIDRQDTVQGQRTRDVRYLSTVNRDGKVRVFRNEDTGWGWPPYFKFDSADLTAKAQTIMQDPNRPWVRVRYYGWRIKIFSLFPNAVSLKVVDKDYTHIPVFNIVFLILLASLAFLFLRWIGRLGERLEDNEHFQSISRSARKLFAKAQG